MRHIAKLKRKKDASVEKVATFIAALPRSVGYEEGNLRAAEAFKVSARTIGRRRAEAEERNLLPPGRGRQQTGPKKLLP
jgi:hypothetical protein